MRRVDEPDPPPRPLRWLWLSLGWLLVLVGGIGAVLPVLPSTIFFILAAACFARSSPRFERWLLDLPRIGPIIRDYRNGLGMRRRAKIWASSATVLALTISLIITHPRWPVMLAAVAFGAIGVGYIVFAVPTRERVLAQREATTDANES